MNQNLSRIHLTRSTGQITFGDVTYRAGGTCGPRIQTDYQLVLMHMGHADVTLDEERTPLHIATGHAALMKPGRREYYRFTVDAVTHHSWCAVRPILVDAALAEEIALRPVVAPFSSRLTSLVRMGLSVGSSRSAAADRLVTQLGTTALLEFLATAEGLAPALPPPLQRTCALIDARYSETVDLAALTRAACVTPAHLIRLFKAHLGTTPVRYLWRVRVESAVRLLRETGLSIGEIATRTGFQNPYHLSRLVKKSYRVSPQELRRRMWNAPTDDSRHESPLSRAALLE